MNPAHAPMVSLRSSAAAAAVAALLAAGLVAIAAPAVPAAAAVAPPAGSELFRVSQTDAGSSTEPFLTPDGQRVFFTSTADDLVPGDANGVSDIFVSVAAPGSDDPFSAAAALVSVPDDDLPDAQADGASSEPVASADGRYVAFTSAATNLVADGGTPGRTSIYVRDTLLGETFRVQGGAEPNGSSYDPDLSDNGRYLVFTSAATDLSAGDVNNAPDAFAADLDANADGVLGDITITRFVPDMSIPQGTEQARISGNGSRVVFVAHQDSVDLVVPPTETSGNFVFYAWGAAPQRGDVVGRNAHSPTIDATGEAFAFIDEDECGFPAIVAGVLDAYFYFAPVGTILIDARVGYIADPVISPDGSRVAWTTTMPEFDFSGPAPELPAPVIRTQEIGWWDSRTTLSCFGLVPDWFDVAEGTEASLSATGRTVAYSAPATAPSSVFALDTHRHEGLDVSSTQGQLGTPGFMTRVDIPTIPLTSLRGYASSIANAPIHQLPIHQLPIHQLPIHQLPIHQLPIHQLPIHQLPIHQLPIHQLAYPGGWDEVLADTPFAGELIQSITLAEVLAWAAATLADGSTATDAERAAAQRIQDLTLGDVGVDGSGLDSLTLASYVLGTAPLGEVPVAGPGGPLENWQSLVNAQGLGFTVEADWYLADLDLAGLDIERSGVDAVPLRDLPVSSTLMRYLDPSELFLSGTPLGEVDVSTFDESARIALFGDPAVTGPLAGFSWAFLPDATVADLAAGAPESVTFGILLMSILNRESYPWEQISASSIDPNLIEASTNPQECDDQIRCGQLAIFRYSFDPGPGEPTLFAAPTASLSTPSGTAPFITYLWGSGPRMSVAENQPYTGPSQVDAETTRVPLADTPGGTVVVIKVWFTATTQPGDKVARGQLTSGALSAMDELFGAAPLELFDDPTRNLVDGQWEAPPAALIDSQVTFEWISPQWRDLNDEGQLVEGPAQDEDYYLVDPPPPGKRLVVSTNATDGQLSLSLYARQADGTSLGVASAGPAPGTAVTEQSGPPGEPAQAGADAGVPLADQVLVDQTVMTGEGVAQVEAASTDVAAEQLLVRVTSGNREPSAALYSLRVQYIDEAPEVACTPWTPAQTADPGVVGTSDPVTAGTNTIYLFDQERYGDTYGAARAAEVRDALASLTGSGHVGTGHVDGAVLAVDASPAVQAARDALDLNPCSMAAREALTSAINVYVGQQLGDLRSQITSVVIVGGDDIIPLAPVAQHTSQFTEVSHADDLRLPATPERPCPPSPGVDPCETPLSAAARTSHILTDDPYGLARAYESLGGHLYVPTVALGRIMEDPDQIIGTIQRFVAADGRLAADSTLTGGYGAWSELPDLITDALSWRSTSDERFEGEWDAAAMAESLFPETGEAPRVVSVNTHADETRMLPGIPGAESGSFADSELFLAQGREDAAQTAGSLIFGIGCHAGNNLPTSYYGDVVDWVDVFSTAGGYVGNTGYGLANNVTTALGERLLSLYAGWIGVTLAGGQVSSGGALTYAKQSYLGGLGLYSGYDEKVVMQSVYYGLPMYTFDGPAKTEMPLPEMPDLSLATTGAITTASLSFQPEFTPETAADGGTYYTVDGSALAVPTAQGVVPSIVRAIEPQSGLTPRGVVLTALTSEFEPGAPALGSLTVGVPAAPATATGSAFPSTYATVTRQDTPEGPVDLLVMTPARVEVPQGGTGTTELFTSFTAEVVFGPEASTDAAPPIIEAIKLPGLRGPDLEVHASDADSGIASVIVLVQPEGSTEWQRLDVEERLDDGRRYWRATPPETPFRWMVQVVDAAGNVATDTARGRLDVAALPAPTLGDPGPDATVQLGERLLRAVEVTDAVPGERLTAYTVVTADGETVSSAPSAVETAPDGTTRALIDQTISSLGAFTVTLTVCRDDSCTFVSFEIETPAPNQAPSASVSLLADSNPVEPTSVLTAIATLDDADGDDVSETYAWARNGVPIADRSGSSLSLDGIAATGDVIRVTVTPDDGTTLGHAASAELVVGAAVVPPAEPEITATATTDGGAYVEGEWSRTAVTVRFTCTSGVPVSSCPDDEVVEDDTAAGGLLVSGTMTDLLGRTATAQVLVRVDGTAPELAPTVTPSTVTLGATAIAEANATDAASGVVSESCDAPDTSTVGDASVECRATDAAGNTATGVARYTVEVPAPDPPTITATATTALGAYVEGEWSRIAVTVEFACTSGVAVTTCPEDRTISADTAPTGLVVTGTMYDVLGRTATAEIVVRVDGTAPRLAPTFEPVPLVAGRPGIAIPNAVDASSGVASQSCDAVDTSKPGAKRLVCRATDVAGNSASVEVKYIVGPAPKGRSSMVGV